MADHDNEANWEAKWRAIDAASNPRQTAAWILGLHAARRVQLDAFERSFVQICAGWYGPLSRRQKPIFERLLARVIRQTGQRPP